MNQGDLLFHIIDSGFLLAILIGVGKLLVEWGSMKTKLDTMWTWFQNTRVNGHAGVSHND